MATSSSPAESAREIEAALLQALDLHLTPEEAVGAFERSLDDGSWTRCQELWVEKLSVLAYRHQSSDPVRRVLSKAIDELVKQRVENVAPTVVPLLFSEWLYPFLGEHSAQRVVNWFIAGAGPGDASIAADTLAHSSGSPVSDGAMLRLGEWLVDNGASELRARRRMRFAVELVGVLAEHGDPSKLLPAIRYVFANDERLERISGFDGDPAYLRFLRALEKLCASGHDGPEIVASFSREFGLHEAGRRLGKLATNAELPALRAAVLRALTMGLVEDRAAAIAWEPVVKSVPATGLAFATLTSVVSALAAFDDHVWENARPGSVAPAWCEDWARLLTAELLRLSAGDSRISPADAARLEHLAAIPGREAVTNGMLTALRKYLAGRENAAVSALLGGSVGSGSLVGALRLLTVQPETRARRATEAFDGEVTARVDAILAHVPAHAYQEIRDLLRECQRTAWDKLENDDKIKIDGKLLRVDRESLHQLLDADLTQADVVIAGVLYVIHEAVHLCQRIGDKTRVAQLRATGAETSLMHVDLGADHVAAIVVADTMPDWSLTKIKHVQGISTAAFPTNSRHTTAARARKAQRLVGLRLDLIAREAGVLDAEANEYAFAEYGPAGGDIVVMRSGPPWGLIGVAPLSRGNAEVLYTAAEPRSSLASVDAVLREAIGKIRAS